MEARNVAMRYRIDTPSQLNPFLKHHTDTKGEIVRRETFLAFIV